ncbi:MAG: phosphatase PAP2 family protein, partial [Parcubacteria group bacterium]|nr:phosphatase PAP2 family protein [Parcubacteria group bacterium]
MDTQLFQIVYGLAGRNQFLDWVGFFFAKYALYVILGVAFSWVVWHKTEWRERLRVFLLALGAAAVSRFIFTELIRILIPRERPYQFFGFDPLIAEPFLDSHSFPSGHASFLFAFATVFFLSRRRAWWMYVVAALVGVARIFVGVHWPSDIAGGMILGVLIGVSM